MGNRFDVRILGSRIKHIMGTVSIKMYDKFGIILRIEVTVNDVSFFQHYREVRHRNGEREKKWSKMKKSIYSLAPLQELLCAANQRYLQLISQVETTEVGVQLLQKLTEAQEDRNHLYKGFNLLADADSSLLRLLLRGEFAISGFTNVELRQYLPHLNFGQVSRLLKRLRMHGLIKKIGKRYKYYLTRLGQQVATMALKLRELYVIPTFARLQLT